MPTLTLFQAVETDTARRFDGYTAILGIAIEQSSGLTLTIPMLRPATEVQYVLDVTPLIPGLEGATLYSALDTQTAFSLSHVLEQFTNPVDSPSQVEVYTVRYIKDITDNVSVTESFEEITTKSKDLRDIPNVSEVVTARMGNYFAEDYEAEDYNSTIYTF